jgi:cyclase
MKGYLEFVQDEARKRLDKGMNAREAAFDISLGRYADWGDAERVVVTVRNLFEQMADFRDKLRAEGHGHHRHVHADGH